MVGLADAESDAEKISEAIKIHLNPMPEHFWQMNHLCVIPDCFALGGMDLLKHTDSVRCKRNIFKEGELDENLTCANFAQVADNGKTYKYKFYSLAAIIAVGYRINSERATQFRTWATKVLDTFTKQGYVLDKSRLIMIRIHR